MYELYDIRGGSAGPIRVGGKVSECGMCADV